MHYAGVYLQLLPKFHVKTREIMSQVDRIDPCVYYNELRINTFKLSLH